MDNSEAAFVASFRVGEMQSGVSMLGGKKERRFCIETSASHKIETYRIFLPQVLRRNRIMGGIWIGLDRK